MSISINGQDFILPYSLYSPFAGAAEICPGVELDLGGYCVRTPCIIYIVQYKTKENVQQILWESLNKAFYSLYYKFLIFFLFFFSNIFIETYIGGIHI